MNDINFKIKENSWLAYIAAKKLGADSVAFVLGKTIHLHNTTKEDFLNNPTWVKHELCHVQQFKQHGFFMFVIKYLYESIKVGYYNNKYEVEARQAENK
ncbi:DUF4157 domain-containing protein [Ferruginibacter sp. SUN106]|uniref:DUF4157 domain-containing protein n=1 Tax=Ferruginibacter sp. SUN106 TaxID=2978348 RepID=UPI003D364B70